MAHDNPFRIRGFKDLKRKNLRFVNRQEDSNTRRVLDHHLARVGLSPADVQGYGQEVHTHLEVGLSILSNEADVGIATGAVSRLLGLLFVPAAMERFDMILARNTFFQPAVQTLLDVLMSDGFRRKAAGIGGYDFKDSGKILYAPVSLIVPTGQSDGAGSSSRPR